MEMTARITATSFNALVERRSELERELESIEQQLQHSNSAALEPWYALVREHRKQSEELKTRHAAEMGELEAKLREDGIRKLPKRPSPNLSEKQWVNAQAMRARGQLKTSGLAKTDLEYSVKIAYAKAKAVLSEEYFQLFGQGYTGEYETSVMAHVLRFAKEVNLEKNQFLSEGVKSGMLVEEHDINPYLSRIALPESEASEEIIADMGLMTDTDGGGITPRDEQCRQDGEPGRCAH